MNVLLVDDQTYVLSGMASGIKWSNLGIQNVFTSVSAENAKRIFTDNKIERSKRSQYYLFNLHTIIYELIIKEFLLLLILLFYLKLL